MSNLQDLSGSNPDKASSKGISVKHAQEVEHDILGTLRDVLHHVKDVHKDKHRIHSQVQDVHLDIALLKQDVQTMRNDIDELCAEISNIRETFLELKQNIRAPYSDIQASDDSEEDCPSQFDGIGRGRALRGAYTSNEQGGRGERGGGRRRAGRGGRGGQPYRSGLEFAEQHSEIFEDEPIQDAGDWNESGSSSANTWGDFDRNVNNSGATWYPTNDPTDQPEQEEIQCTIPEIDPEDPNNLAPIDDYHFDWFRATITQLGGLVEKFNQLPADAFSKLDDPTRSLFVQILQTVQIVHPQGVVLAKFSNQSFTIVDTVEKVRSMIDILTALPLSEPNIAIDLEGKSLGRDGPVYLAIIHDYASDHTYVVDVHNLQTAAFDTCGEREAGTLRSILESPDVPKMIYDVRQDSDALYHQFNIKLDGILDVQLFQLAAMSQSFNFPAQYRTGLFKAISSGIDMNYDAKQKWLDIKRIGKDLWAPEQGGSWDRFIEPNKCKEIIEYCLVDVVHLRTLYRKAVKGLSERWIERVKDTTKDSIEETWDDDFESSGARGPW